MPLLNIVPNTTNDQIRNVLVDESPSHRSLANLIQGCVLTIFACVWTSIHPNIPGPNESGWQLMRRRVLTMVYALIAPEIVAIWALRQYFAARKIAAMYNQEFCSERADISQISRQNVKSSWLAVAQPLVNFFSSEQSRTPWKLSTNSRWTRTHGFFVQMGGFLLYDPSGNPLRVPDYEGIAQLLRQKTISPSALCITEREIHDRSKGDSISKGVVVLQTTWFVVQALCRMRAGLPLCGVEVLTLAFAVMNGAVYAIWWEKPQGVEMSVPVRMRVATREVGTSTEDKSNPAEDVDAHLSCQEVKLATTTECKEPKGQQYDQMRDELSSHTLKTLCAFLPMAGIFCNALLLPLQKMALCENIPTNAIRVPMFYAHPKWRENTSEIVFSGPIIGAVFGAVHLLAWSSDFPSHVEQYLWRAGALIITAVPTLVIFLGFLGDTTEKQRGEGRYSVPSLVFTGTIPFYVVARLILITLALTSLRALPQQAFIEVSWTSFIPHL